MKICLQCSLPATKSAVIAGKYYSRLCVKHFNELTASQMPSSGQASYNRQRDLEDHQADIIQPRVGGRLNPEFARMYPDKARQMFSQTELDEAERRG